MDLQLVELHPKHNAAVAKLIRSVFEDHGVRRKGTVCFDPTTDDLSSVFTTARSKMWLAVAGSEVMGCAGVFPTPGLPEGYCEYVKFYVASEHQGKGIGKLLMQKCVDTAREFGYTHLYLESIPEFSTAISIYERIGFKSLPSPLGNSGHFGCTIWMEKNIED